MITFDDCINRGLIKISSPAEGEIDKELNEAGYDLDKAIDSCRSGDSKWATVQAYYSMFHMTRAVLFSMSYKERSHICLEIFLDKLVSDNQLSIDYAQHFRTARFQREEADYRSGHSPERAAYVIKLAIDFNLTMKKLVKNVP